MPFCCTDAEGSQSADMAPLNILANVGACQTCVANALEDAAKLVLVRGRKTSVQQLADALSDAGMGPRSVHLSSRNTLRYKCTVKCYMCNSDIATVDSDIESTAAPPKNTKGGGGSGGQGELCTRMRNVVASGRGSEADMRRNFAGLGFGEGFDSTRLGTKAQRSAAPVQERVCDDQNISRALKYIVPSGEEVTIAWAEMPVLQIGSLGPIMSAVVKGQWDDMSLPVRKLLTEHGVPELHKRHSLGNLIVEQTDAGVWQMYSTGPVELRSNAVYNVSADASYSAGRQSSEGQLTALLQPQCAFMRPSSDDSEPPDAAAADASVGHQPKQAPPGAAPADAAVLAQIDQVRQQLQELVAPTDDEDDEVPRPRGGADANLSALDVLLSSCGSGGRTVGLRRGAVSRCAVRLACRCEAFKCCY